MTEQDKYAFYIQTAKYFNLCKPEAYKYAKEGYEKGSILCGFFLGWCLFHGLGCDKNLEESFKVFQVIRPVVRKEARGRNPQYTFIESLYYSYG